MAHPITVLFPIITGLISWQCCCVTANVLTTTSYLWMFLTPPEALLLLVTIWHARLFHILQCPRRLVNESVLSFCWNTSHLAVLGLSLPVSLTLQQLYDYSALRVTLSLTHTHKEMIFWVKKINPVLRAPILSIKHFSHQKSSDFFFCNFESFSMPMLFYYFNKKVLF